MKDKNPFVTVGVIARNEEKHIGETITNLTKIDYPNDSFEIILVDGNSNDKTRDIVKDIAKKSKILIKVVNEKDFGFYGPCFARNLVVKNSSSKAKYVAFTDADCKVEKGWLKNLVEIMESKGKKKDIAGSGGPRLIYDDDPVIAKIINFYMSSFLGSGGSSAFSKKKIEFAESIANYNAIYKKEILIKIPYDDKLVLSDDNEVNYRIRKKGYKFLYNLDAKVWHHEDPSIWQFAINMKRYGDNISRPTLKHGKLIRWFSVIPSLFLIGLVFGGLLSLIFTPIRYVYLGVIGLYFILVLLNSILMIVSSRCLLGILGIILAPIQHICYGYGFILGLFKNKKLVK
ncbi:family 2 glycosyl transferase [Candidatus Woesearchaeota archaeon]|nr:MAG: family 2 glycosyl transferase [Candidatus Woesearchaeota archaeon]